MTAKVLLPASVAAFLSFLSPAFPLQAQPPEARATQSQERTAAPQSAPRPHEPLSPGKSALRILYAGYPDSPRGQDFVNFLRPFFREVKAVNVLEFDEKAAAGYSVVIIDNHRWSHPDRVASTSPASSTTGGARPASVITWPSSRPTPIAGSRSLPRRL